jgi:hypothetical protein
MATKGSPTGKRETIAPDDSRRYMRRDTNGRFTDDQVKSGRSVARDKRTDAKHSGPKGMKDRGD